MKFKIIAVLILIIGAAAGYKFYTYKVDAEAAPTYETAKVVRMNLKKTVSATGTVQPRESVEISSKVTARIKEVLVNENDVVTEGQTLVLLDGKDYQAKLEQARFKLTNASQKLTRISKLYEIGAKSKEELENAQYDYDSAKSDVEVAESNMNEMIILSPMSGIVVGEPKIAGTMATQGTNTPTVIMRIADLSEKLIKAKVDETDIGNIREGETAHFIVDAYPDEIFVAKVVKISQTDTANSWDVGGSSSSSSSSSSSNSVIYYYVTFTVPDDGNKLLPAMTARLDIIVGQVAGALCVPIAAIRSDGKNSYVERVTVGEDGKQVAEKVPVTLGLYGEEYVEVTSGDLNLDDDISVTYKTEKKATGNNSGGNRGPGGGMPGGGMPGGGRRMPI